MSTTTMPEAAPPKTLADLRKTLESAYSRLPLDGRPVALVDLPSYLNIGDSLITLGEFELLKATHPNMKGVYFGSDPSSDVLAQLNNAGGVLLIHGGGNFGSIWPRHQEFREHAARTMSNTTIVQLPQSVHFDSPDRLQLSLDVLADHPDFHIMVRDQASYDQLAPFPLASLQLMPDSAFALQLDTPPPATTDVLVLRRQDSESQHAGAIDEVMRNLSDFSSLSGDWASDADLPVPWPKAHQTMTRMWSRLARRSKSPGLQRLGWHKLSRARMELGRRIISHGRVVLTDRLHVHVQCVLLGKPHVFFDNSYGKIRGLAEACGTLGPNAVAAADAADATEHLRRLLGEAGATP
ncbi:MAG: polysaccharide pyruvyl transferase family protein [Phycisphaera sp.]|nr:MAG: polysaccharide pyruvyl transferase family protein [Phycisphaera sp.]